MPAWLVFSVGAVLSGFAWRTAEVRIQTEAQSKAHAAVADASEAIQARITNSFDLMLGIRALFSASEHVNREAFSRYVNGLNLAQRHPGIRSINYAQRVPAHLKDEFEQSVRQDSSIEQAGYPNFAIRPAGVREEYVPILYREPITGAESSLGLDLYTEERREAIERARDSGMPVVSGRLVLVTDATRQPAFTVRLAVYRNHTPIDTLAARREAFVGVLSTVFRVSDLIDDVMTQSTLASMSVSIYDRAAGESTRAGAASGGENLMFSKPAALAFSETDRDFFAEDVSIDVGGRNWQLQFRGVHRAFVTPTDRAQPWILLIGGLVMSALLASLMRSLASSRERAHRTAAQITDDLRQSEAKLAEAQRLTQAMIEALPNPIFFKGTDGRYLGVNQAWEKFFGIPRSAFIGKTVYDLYPNDKPIADRLDALDQVLWERPGSQTYEAVIPGADGATHDVLYYKATYARSDGTVVGLIGTIIDISERKQAERRQTMEHAITRVLAEAESIATAVPKIIQTICEAMQWHYGDRYEYDAEAEVLRRREFWATNAPEMQAFAASAAHRTVRPDGTGTGLIRRTYAAGKPVWIADIAQHAGLQRKELLEKAGLHGAFAFPLIAGGQVLGVIEFFHRDVREPDATLIQIAESIGSQIGQFLVRMQSEEAVTFVAMHDALTHLPNRVMFHQSLEQAIAQAQRHEKRLAVMFIDLDRFKVINDTLGHEAGDQLLREVAQRLTETLRTGDIVARLGGDEFVVLLQDVSDPAAVGAVAEKLVAALASNFTISEREVHTGASIGISVYPRDAQDMRSLLKFADMAMYRAKEQGRSTFQFYSDQIKGHSVERLTLESQLRRAIEREELVLHYQPVINARTNRVTGMEALLRWTLPDVGMIAPAEFIGMAEETGLIVPIGEWALHTACEQQSRWIEKGIAPLRVSVNLSPRQFLHRHLADDIVKVLRDTRCEARHLQLEITESTVMHNAARAVELLTEFKGMGIQIAIDDFGTGYSSLAYLKRFPIDHLKIDRSFVSDVPGDASDTAITQAIIAMAHSLGLTVIAEGVETAEQVTFLREHACEEMQGYFFSCPLAVDEASVFLQKSINTIPTAQVMLLERSRPRH